MLLSSRLLACSLLHQVNISASELACGRWLSRTEPQFIFGSKRPLHKSIVLADGAAGLGMGKQNLLAVGATAPSWQSLAMYPQICGLTSKSFSLPICKMGNKVNRPSLINLIGRWLHSGRGCRHGGGELWVDFCLWKGEAMLQGPQEGGVPGTLQVRAWCGAVQGAVPPCPQGRS